ncbi:MAG: hypothetical protein ACE5GM_01460 [bacterium]
MLFSAASTIFLTFSLVLGGAVSAKPAKTEELWYAVYENGEKVGQQVITYRKMPGGTKGLLKINRRMTINNDSLISPYHLELNSSTILEGDAVISHRIEVKENNDRIEGRASGDLTGYAVSQSVGDKQYERRILFKDFECTDLSFPHKCFNQKGITSITRQLNWETMEVIPTEIKYIKDTLFATKDQEVSCLVIRYKNRRSDRIDWVTADGILLQSSGKNKRGSFLIKAASKQKATAPK